MTNHSVVRYDDATHAFHAQGLKIYKPDQSVSQSVVQYDDAAHAFHAGIAQGPTIYKPYSQSVSQSVVQDDDAVHAFHAGIARKHA